MIKKIIHLADVHIRTFRMHEEYTEAFELLNTKIKELIKGFERDEVRIVIAGDLVHQKITISNEQLMLTTSFLKDLEGIAPVIIIAGNHDLLENNNDRMDSITPLVKLLEGKQIAYFKKSKCYEDSNIVWCTYSIFEGNSRPDIEQARIDYGNDKKYIGLYHAPIMGAKTDIGYEFDHGGDLKQFEGCDAVIMGDIHKHQEFVYNNAPVVYSSSLIQQDYGESIKGHGFLEWDVENLTYTFHELESNYGFYKFKISSVDDIINGEEILVNK
jgi:DNA repair exonuclease SbcCD nuclease subunit